LHQQETNQENTPKNRRGRKQNKIGAANDKEKMPNRTGVVGSTSVLVGGVVKRKDAQTAQRGLRRIGRGGALRENGIANECPSKRS